LLGGGETLPRHGGGGAVFRKKTLVLGKKKRGLRKGCLRSEKAC